MGWLHPPLSAHSPILPGSLRFRTHSSPVTAGPKERMTAKSELLEETMAIESGRTR
jgi:hypothetical protein